MTVQEKINIRKEKIKKSQEKIKKEQENVKKYEDEIKTFEALAIKGLINELDMPYEELAAFIKDLKGNIH